MRRLTLALLLGSVLLVSFSAHAGGRGGHYGKDHRQLNKHHRHHAHHQRHASTRGHHYHRCWNDGHHRHGRIAQPYVVPGLEFGVAYGASGLQTVIVYQERRGR